MDDLVRPPKGGKATWVWDDSPEYEFGQLYMPVCRVCGRGPLTGEDIETGLCGEDDCEDPYEKLRTERDILEREVIHHRNLVAYLKAQGVLPDDIHPDLYPEWFEHTSDQGE